MMTKTTEFLNFNPTAKWDYFDYSGGSLRRLHLS
jgi:hypothetical protein